MMKAIPYHIVRVYKSSGAGRGGIATIRYFMTSSSIDQSPISYDLNTSKARRWLCTIDSSISDNHYVDSVVGDNKSDSINESQTNSISVHTRSNESSMSYRPSLDHSHKKSKIDDYNNNEIMRKLALAKPSRWPGVQRVIREEGIQNFDFGSIARLFKWARFDDYNMKGYLYEIALAINKDIEKPVVAIDFVNIFTGLSKMLIGDANTQALLLALLKRLKYLETPLTTTELALCSKSWFNMRAEFTAVRKMALRFAELIANCPDEFSPRELSNMIYNCSNLSCEYKEIRVLIDSLARRLAQLPPTSIENNLVSSMLSGLYSMRLSSKGYREVARLTDAIIPFITSMNEPFSANQLAVSVYGLRYMSSESSAVRSLLSAIVGKMPSSSSAPLSDKKIAMLMSGMRNLDSDVVVVRDFVNKLVPVIAPSCDGEFESLSSNMVLFGFQSMSLSSSEVKTLLSTIAPAITKCSQPWFPQDVASSVFGLRRMSSEDKLIQQLIHFLTGKLNSSTGTWNVLQITMLLRGLASFSSYDPKVTGLLNAITQLLSRPDFVDLAFDCQGVGSALQGFRQLNSRHKSVANLVSIITPMIERCQGTPSARDIANALSGLYHMRIGSAAVQNLISALSSFVQRGEKLDAAGIAISLYGLRHLNNRDSPELNKLLQILNEKSADCETVMTFQELLKCLYGLSSMDIDSPSVTPLLRLISIHLCAIPPGSVTSKYYFLFVEEFDKWIKRSDSLSSETKDIVASIREAINMVRSQS